MHGWRIDGGIPRRRVSRYRNISCLFDVVCSCLPVTATTTAKSIVHNILKCINT